MALIGVVAACTTTTTTNTSNNSNPSQDTDAGVETDAAPQEDPSDNDAGPAPIAPECTNQGEWCAQGEASAVLSCKDVDKNEYTITTTFSGKTDNVSCSVDGSDLLLRVGPPQADTEAYNTHWVQFRLTNYNGGGTYELVRTADQDIDWGFELQGKTGGSMADEKSDTAGTWACGPSPCKAVVAPESQPLPNDPNVVQEFRLRVSIQCDAAGKLWWHPDCNDTDCNFEAPPKFDFDIVCSK